MLRAESIFEGVPFALAEELLREAGEMRFVARGVRSGEAAARRGGRGAIHGSFRSDARATGAPRTVERLGAGAHQANAASCSIFGEYSRL